MKRISALMICLLAILMSVAAAPERETVETTPSIVTTTSWTAAFAYAAGAESVHVLAPYELRHPPEYELSPSDIVVVSDADLVIFAGYEVMLERLREAVGSDGPEMLQIVTDYSLATIESSVAAIAERIGTEEAAVQSIEQIRRFYADWRHEVAAAGFAGAGVITHRFLVPFVSILGAEALGVFGPAPLEARQIATLSELPAKLIVDNYHVEVGRPLRETMPDTPVVEFLNFPGTAGTVTLLDVLEENRLRLAAVLSE